MSEACLVCRAKKKACNHALGKRYLVIPDCQVKPGVPLDHMDWIGKYAAHKRFDGIVCIGDFGDLPSLSSWDKGKKAMENRRYRDDLGSIHEAMTRLMKPIRASSGYNPTLDMTLGNHEDRISRAIENDAVLEGTMSLKDLKYEEFGWRVHPFKKIVTLDQVQFVHFFTSGVMQRPVGSAAAMLKVAAGSAIQGHAQRVDIAVHESKGFIAMMVGTCYLHSEDYLSYQGNNCRRQVVVLNEVKNGVFDPMLVSLDFLRLKYGS